MSRKKRKTTESFIEEAKQVHGDKYNYSKVDYRGCYEPVNIICPIHGEFYQKPYIHLGGHGCPLCGMDEIKLSLSDKVENVIKKATIIHNGKYDYSKVNYTNNREKVCIICHERDEDGNEHGEFWQSMGNHLNGHGCPKCCKNHNAYNTETYIARANKVHNNKYDYSKTIYIKKDEKVCIICPEHGEFWQSAGSHLLGHGCPICRQSFSENEIDEMLKSNGIIYEREKGFDWLQYRIALRLDFYLPDYNIAIECQGRQHFMPIDYFGGQQGLEDCIARDSLKRQLCKEHGIKILYYADYEYDFPYEVITDKEVLLENIRKSK